MDIFSSSHIIDMVWCARIFGSMATSSRHSLSKSTTYYKILVNKFLKEHLYKLVCTMEMQVNQYGERCLIPKDIASNRNALFWTAKVCTMPKWGPTFSICRIRTIVKYLDNVHLHIFKRQFDWLKYSKQFSVFSAKLGCFYTGFSFPHQHDLRGIYRWHQNVL